MQLGYGYDQNARPSELYDRNGPRYLNGERKMNYQECDKYIGDPHEPLNYERYYHHEPEGYYNRYYINQYGPNSGRNGYRGYSMGGYGGYGMSGYGLGGYGGYGMSGMGGYGMGG